MRISLDAFELPGQPDGRKWIVEGAGGVMVPLNERDLMLRPDAADRIPRHRRRAHGAGHDQSHASDARGACARRAWRFAASC